MNFLSDFIQFSGNTRFRAKKGKKNPADAGFSAVGFGKIKVTIYKQQK